MIMAHNSLVLLLTYLHIAHLGKTCNFPSAMCYFFFCQWQHTRMKVIFRESIFLWVFEIQEHNHDERTVTAADIVVAGGLLVKL